MAAALAILFVRGYNQSPAGYVAVYSVVGMWLVCVVTVLLGLLLLIFRKTRRSGAVTLLCALALPCLFFLGIRASESAGWVLWAGEGLIPFGPNVVANEVVYFKADVLRLAMKGTPFMEGTLRLDTRIEIPPLSGKVKEKLMLDGTFDVSNGKFLKSNIQDQIDTLSRKGQGKPKSQEIDEVVSHMAGDFHLENETLTFRSLAFAVIGAAVNIDGTYDMDADMLDFHGALLLDAKVSETQSGWKRWVLKPVDPFFSKNGVGTYLKIKVVGSSKKPEFGLDKGK